MSAACLFADKLRTKSEEIAVVIPFPGNLPKSGSEVVHDRIVENKQFESKNNHETNNNRN